MENNNTTQTQTEDPRQKKELVLVRDTNEWGQMTDLEKNATYFVIRKPTRELTQQKSREFIDDVKLFLHEHRVLNEKQFEDIDKRYGEPARQKAKDIRETMEKKFDELAKEFEARVEQLETEYKTRFGRKEHSSTTTAETPGEMPTGEGAHDAPATDGATGSTNGETKNKSTPKKTTKKND